MLKYAINQLNAYYGDKIFIGKMTFVSGNLLIKGINFFHMEKGIDTIIYWNENYSRFCVYENHGCEYDHAFIFSVGEETHIFEVENLLRPINKKHYLELATELKNSIMSNSIKFIKSL